MTATLGNKSVLITGSDRGIGKAIALAFANAGARVAVHGLATPDEAKAVVREMHDAGSSDARFFNGDLRNADEIDALGLSWRPSAPSFFRRTSREVCKAITALDDPQRATILKNHIARIDNSRLRRAFRAAVDLREKSPRP